ncbi:hypothetical protein V8C42DRAFT_332320 [Trichoderma barbatum]
MASIPQLAPETMVTLKVTFENTTRRVKMPLRDMVPQILEANIRHFLHITPETQVTIERYSDSASAFVVLDSNNLPVYKQLYRAAKAKSKLKLRVSVPQLLPKSAPKPVTVEDEPEASVAETYESTEKTTPTESDESSSTTEPATEMPVPSAAPSSITLLSGVELPLRTSSSVQLDMTKVEETEAPVTQKLPANFAQSAPFDPQSIYSSFEDYCAPAAQSHHVIAPAPFAVCCNHCEKTVSDVHYHCQTCDDGDFDLCQACVDQAVSCYDDNHWLIKRTMIDGQLIASSTERIEPKSQAKKQAESLAQGASILQSIENPEEEEKEALKITRPEKTMEQPAVEEPLRTVNVAPAFLPPSAPSFGAAGSRWSCMGTMRTCNCCVQELPEFEFLHCTTCEDFDLCQACFAKDAHGHHPKHGFVPAVAGTKMPDHVAVRMSAGRNQAHHAICDGCDKYITGVRHKCLDCPDWDYCSDCVPNAPFVHASHRFAPIYEPLADIHACAAAQPVHMGICCDGPLCSNAQGYPTYIRGVRYKCAVCHDLDFCASCEANPANDHNKTHPLIKFKTPVRHVSVTTTGEHQDGKRMPPMGDRAKNVFRPSETSTLSDSNTINAVQTVVDVKPEEPETEDVKVKQEPEVEVKQEEPTPEIKEEIKEEKAAEVVASVSENDLRAVFIRDSVSDGTIMPPNHVFEQTWVLRNEGTATWPAGCSVKFVGGDYMGHVDSAHPAGISELVSASESTVCYAPLAPGSEFPFTVLLRTPARAGQIISYWRLTTPDGFKFGHRLWCDVSVRMPPAEVLPASTVVEPKKEEEEAQTGSVMIFPKLDKESPDASIHREVQARSVAGTVETETQTASGEEYEWDGSDDGFMTDEEYDILDASDEEYLEDRENKRLRK